MADQVIQGIDWKNPDYDPVFLERAKRIARIRATPGMLEGLKEHFKHNPVDFVNSFGMTFDPRLVDLGIEATVPFVLFPRQAEFVEWVVARWMAREDGVVEKSRDMGVSWLCVAVAVWMWIFHPGVVIGFGSRKETYVDDVGNPASLFWKIRQFVNLLPRELRPEGWDDKKHAPFMRVLNPENGSAIVGEAGDNIGRGNRCSVYFVDEAAFLERPDAVDAALSQTANCKLYVSTPNGAGNSFYRKRHGGKVPVFVFDWRQDSRKDDAWYRKQCETLDAHVVAQEIDRDYEASVLNAFIAGDLVDDAMSRGPASVERVGGLRVGVDPARFGDDKFAVTVRRGRALLLQAETQKVDSFQGAAFVKATIAPFGEKPEQIAVDEIGVGAGVLDVLASPDWYGDIVVGVNSSLRMDGDAAKRAGITNSKTHYYNVRAYMWGEMREWLENAAMQRDGDLKAEMCAVRYSYRGGSILLESKDDMRSRGVKSPNKADSLALTFARPVTNSARSHPALTHAAINGRKPATRAGY